MNLIKRQDGTRSRTKQLNLAGLGVAVIGAVLPAFQVYIPEAVYSGVMAVWVALNQHFRTTQSSL